MTITSIGIVGWLLILVFLSFMCGFAAAQEWQGVATVTGSGALIAALVILFTSESPYE